MQFMTHKDHGATHVNSGEIEAHKANGWVESTYEEWLSAKTPKPAGKVEIEHKNPGRKPRNAQ